MPKTYKYLLLILLVNTIYGQAYLRSIEQFREDSIKRIIYKQNNIKSITETLQNYNHKRLDVVAMIWGRKEIDTNGNIIKEWRPDTNVKVYDYHMNPVFLIDSTTYKYDSLNRLIKEVTHFRKRDEFTLRSYDSVGRIAKIEEYYKGEVLRWWELEYDMFNNRIFEKYDYDDSQRSRGTIYLFKNGRIKKIQEYYGKKYTLLKEYKYTKNQYIEYEYYPNGDIYYITTYKLTKNGLLYEKIREYDDQIINEWYKYDNSGNQIYGKWLIRYMVSSYSQSKEFLHWESTFAQSGLELFTVYYMNGKPDEIRKFIYEYHK